MADNANPNPEIKVLLTISVNKDDVVMVSGDLNNKKLCYHLLAEAIKIVTDYQPAVIKSSLFDRTKHNMLDFARHLKRGG